MLNAFSRALGQLTDPRILRILGVVVLLSIASFLASWFGIGWLLTSTRLVDIAWLDTAIDVLGGLATLLLTWLLFPLVASAFVALFLDRIAVAVEARYYPDLPPSPGIPWWQGLLCSLRFLGLVLVMNVLLLPLLLLLWIVPPAYPVGYYAVNGFLLGREYFDLVALRRLQPGPARALRQRHSGELLATGVVGAILATVPLVNFIAPVIVTAAMVHRFEAWRRAAR